MPAPRPPAPRPPAASRPGDERCTDLIRWAAFSCVLVPVVLLWYGTSLAGAAGTALGLAAVTAVCRLLLRRSERSAARLLTEETGEAETGRETGEAEGAPEAGVPAAQAHHRGRHQRTGTGAHRGGRHSGGNSPVG